MGHKPLWFSMISYMFAHSSYSTLSNFVSISYIQKVLLYSCTNKFSFKTFSTLAPYSKS